MTIITNEIHIIDGLNKSIILFAADRRLSTTDGNYHSTRKKLFKIQYLEAGVSYFGLAEVFPHGKRQYLSDWLPAFITINHDVPNLEVFSQRLRNELNRIVPSNILKNMPSGFHLAGYNENGYPDFFYFSNIGRSKDFRYVDLGEKYGEPASHFLGRDAKLLGWDGVNPQSVKPGSRIYRNGDIRAHVIAWEELDKMLLTLFQFPDFKRPSTVNEYEVYVKTKLEMLAYVYKKFAQKEIIASPIDVFCLQRL